MALHLKVTGISYFMQVSSMNLYSIIAYCGIIVTSFRTSSCRTFFQATGKRNENSLIYIQSGVKETVTFLC